MNMERGDCRVFPEAKTTPRQAFPLKWGQKIARGWATLLLDRLGDFIVAPFSSGGTSAFEQNSQGAKNWPLWTINITPMVSD